MRLYAKVTGIKLAGDSETTVIKGQGSNKHLEIEITDELNQVFCRLLVQIGYKGAPVIALWKDSHINMAEFSSEHSILALAESIKTKGEKQKGEHKCNASETHTNKYGEQELGACTCK